MMALLIKNVAIRIRSENWATEDDLRINVLH